MSDTVIMTIRASAPRRLFAICVLWGLGGIFLYLATLVRDTDFSYLIMLFALGTGALWAGKRLHQATKQEIYLTDKGLCDSQGRVIANLDQIKSIDRGVFAFKPSNGFVLRLSTSPGFAWQPGMWWRIGQSAGVGGVLSAGQTKAVAEMISEQIPHK